MNRMLASLVALSGALALSSVGTGSDSPPPLPPPPPSPIAFFRTLLSTNSTGRDEALAARTAAQRRAILAKLAEYDAMPEKEREQRLRATEFRYYLRPLLQPPPTGTHRQAQIDGLPVLYREMIRERVARWDALPAASREELLGYDRALTWLARTRLQAIATLTGPPPPPSGDPMLDQELARWRSLPDAHRDELCRQFESFFELPDPEQERALATFSDEERERMETTLAAFAKLPPAERRVCLLSFQKFASLSPAERAAFLRSAERWREMSPEDREQWRQLVNHLPPLPPGFESPPPLPPPPPHFVQGATSPSR